MGGDPHPEKEVARRVRRGPEGWGGGRRVGAQNFAFFFPSPAPIFIIFPLSGGLLVEFWWCFGRSGPQMCLLSPSGCRVEAPGSLQAELRSINPRQEATDNATPCTWAALRAQQRLLRVGQSGHEHTVPVVFLNPGCCFVLPPMSHSTRLSVLRIVGRWAESVCKRFP